MRTVILDECKRVSWFNYFKQSYLYLVHFSKNKLAINYLLTLTFFFFLLFRAPPAAYGGSQTGVESELQLPAYATAAATSDLSRVCDLHHSSWQRQILNPLNEIGDRTLNLTVPSRIHFCCITMGTAPILTFGINYSYLFPSSSPILNCRTKSLLGGGRRKRVWN